MIPYDAEKLLLFLEEEEFIVNKVGTEICDIKQAEGSCRQSGDAGGGSECAGSEA